MKVKGVFFVSVMVLGFSVAACAKDSMSKADDKPAATNAVVTELRLIQAQEIRLVVLQQLFNQEAAVLKQKHTAFCQTNKLDEEKFKKGLYRYDEVNRKFNEVAATATPVKK